MLHNSRIFNVVSISSLDALAHRLVHQKMKLCLGFYHDGLLYLNDSIADGAPTMIAVLKTGHFPKPGRTECDQVGVMALTGCSAERVAETILEMRDAQPFARVIIQIDAPDHICPLCAFGS